MNSVLYHRNGNEFADWLNQSDTLKLVDDLDSKIVSILLPDGQLIHDANKYREIYQQYAWMDCLKGDYLHRILTTKIDDTVIIVGKAYTNPFKSTAELIETIKLASELTWNRPDRFDYHAFNMWMMTSEVLTDVERYAISVHLFMAR